MRWLVISLSFAFFVMCPRMAGMCAVVSKIHNVNPYLVSIVGGLIAVPLITLMVYVTLRFGVVYAIALAVLTDLISALATGTFRLKYGIEIALISIFVWMGVVVAGKVSGLIESMLR